MRINTVLRLTRCSFLVSLNRSAVIPTFHLKILSLG